MIPGSDSDRDRGIVVWKANEPLALRLGAAAYVVRLVTHLKFVLKRKSCFAEHARCHCEHLQNLPCSVIVTLVNGTGVIFQALNIVAPYYECGDASQACSWQLVTVRRTRAGHLCNVSLDMLYSEAVPKHDKC